MTKFGTDNVFIASNWKMQAFRRYVIFKTISVKFADLTGETQYGMYTPEVVHGFMTAPCHYFAGIVCLFGHLWPLLLTWFNFNPSMDK